jgi:xanthine dehydrogenase small subunit
MAEIPNVVRFVLDGKLTEAEAVAPSSTLLDYLREYEACASVKEGCAEGDCGACTEALGELDGDAITWCAVNSCIRFMPSIDGKEVVTAQGLVDGQGALHPVQQAMVDCHASQCDFCRHGFVMSLFTHYLELNGAPAEREALLNALSGNLCRCTGYRPIIDAGLCMHDYPQSSVLNTQEASSSERVARLQGLKRSTALQPCACVAIRHQRQSGGGRWSIAQCGFAQLGHKTQ